jgi:predicted small secreted protein
MKKIILLVIIMVMVLTGCNTFKGMGKDIEGAGHGIQKAADKTKEAITK